MATTSPRAVMQDPLQGFYDPSNIGSYEKTAASQIQPDVKPIANVAGSYGGAPTPTPGSVPSPIDSGLPADPFSSQPTPGYPVQDLNGTGQPMPTGVGTEPGSAGFGGLSPGATATAATAANTGGQSWWDQFINGLTGGHGIAGELGAMAPYLADFALAQKYADKQQSETNKTIQPLFTQATQYLDAATKDLKLYESGTVNPAQQKMIDAYSVSQKAQVAQQLQTAGISDSGALNSAYQQIDNNAMMMKQNFVQQSLSNAINLEQAGMQPLMIAIQDKLLSDTEISRTMMELTGTLAQAWAYQQGQEARGGVDQYGKAGAAGVTGGLVKDATKYAEGKVKDWIGGSATGSAADAMGAAGLTDLSGSAAADMAALTGVDMGITPASLAGGGGAAAAGGAGLLPGSVAGANMADTAAFAPSAIEASSPAAAGAGAVAGGLALGAGAFGAAYGLSRIIANSGKMSPQDWKKKMAGVYATSEDKYKAAVASGDIDQQALTWHYMEQAAQGYASRLAATGDPNDKKLSDQIYAQFGQRQPDWYVKYLRDHRGGLPGGGMSNARPQ